MGGWGGGGTKSAELIVNKFSDLFFPNPLLPPHPLNPVTFANHPMAAEKAG